MRGAWEKSSARTKTISLGKKGRAKEALKPQVGGGKNGKKEQICGPNWNDFGTTPRRNL